VDPDSVDLSSPEPDILVDNEQSPTCTTNMNEALEMETMVTENEIESVSLLAVLPVVKLLKIEDVVGETIFDLSCSVVNVLKTEQFSILTVEDGTLSRLNSMSWRQGSCCESQMESSQIDIQITHPNILRKIKIGEIVIGKKIKLKSVECELFKKYDSQGESMQYTDSKDLNTDAFIFKVKTTENMLDGVEVDEVEGILWQSSVTIKRRNRNDLGKKGEVGQSPGDRVAVMESGADLENANHEEEAPPSAEENGPATEIPAAPEDNSEPNATIEEEKTAEVPDPETVEALKDI